MSRLIFMWALSRDYLKFCVNKQKCPEQPAHPPNPIGALHIHKLERIIIKLNARKVAPIE